MKKFIIAMLVIFIVGAVIIGIGCAVYFSGDNRFFSKDAEYVQKEYNCKSADITDLSLNLTDAHNLIFKSGDNFAVNYSDSLLTEFDITESGGKLFITERSNKIRWFKRILYKSECTDVTVTLPDSAVISLNAIVKGAVNSQISNREFTDISLSVLGAGHIKMSDVCAENMTLNISGAAEVDVIGNFNNYYLNANGSAKMELSGMVQKLKADISGSAELECSSLYCDDVELNCSGSSDIELSGGGKQLKVNSSGSTHLDAQKFPVDTAYIKSSGNIDAKISVENQLTVSANGSGRIYYWGHPFITNESDRWILIQMD